MQVVERKIQRVWRIRRDAPNAYEYDEFLDVGPFQTFDEAQAERELLTQKPEFMGTRLSIFADPPMPHGRANLDGI